MSFCLLGKIKNTRNWILKDEQEFARERMQGSGVDRDKPRQKEIALKKSGILADLE